MGKSDGRAFHSGSIEENQPMNSKKRHREMLTEWKGRKQAKLKVINLEALETRLEIWITEKLDAQIIKFPGFSFTS